MKSIARLSYISAVLFAALLTGCGGNSPSACSHCFSVHTNVTVNGMNKIDPGVAVSGMVEVPGFEEQIDCDQNPTGGTSLSGTTNDKAVLGATNAAMGHSCFWSFTRGTSFLCPAPNVVNQLIDQPGRDVPLPCGVQVNTFLATPDDISPEAPPSP
jgi:hypothetical protein